MSRTLSSSRMIWSISANYLLATRRTTALSSSAADRLAGGRRLGGAYFSGPHFSAMMVYPLPIPPSFAVHSQDFVNQCLRFQAPDKKTAPNGARVWGVGGRTRNIGI